MRFSKFLVVAGTLFSIVHGQASSTSSPVPTPSHVVPPNLIRREYHVVQRNNVTTTRHISIVKQRLSQQIGPVIAPFVLTQGTDSAANYTATVNRAAGPSGFIHFLSILHGRWFRLFGFADGRFVPTEMQQYTIGNPLVLETFGKYTIEAFLNAPIRLLIYDTPTNGTVITWELPTTQLVSPGRPVPQAAYTASHVQDELISKLVNYIAFGN